MRYIEINGLKALEHHKRVLYTEISSKYFDGKPKKRIGFSQSVIEYVNFNKVMIRIPNHSLCFIRELSDLDALEERKSIVSKLNDPTLHFSKEVQRMLDLETLTGISYAEGGKTHNSIFLDVLKAHKNYLSRSKFIRDKIYSTTYARFGYRRPLIFTTVISDFGKELSTTISLGIPFNEVREE